MGGSSSSFAAFISSRNISIESFVPMNKRRLLPEIESRMRPPSSSVTDIKGGSVRVTQFGADPSGKTDSSAALEGALSEALSRDSGHYLADGVVDLGGVKIDLEGGNYLISRPLVVPMWVGNFRFADGTLRASPEFPKGEYMVSVGSLDCRYLPKYTCNEHIGFSNLSLDCSHVAGGGIQFSAVMGANVGPFIMVVSFTKIGIDIRRGHEVVIHEAWLGEYYYSHDQAKNAEKDAKQKATAISIVGNDHVLDNVIVFSAKFGVYLDGSASLLRNVHASR